MRLGRRQGVRRPRQARPDHAAAAGWSCHRFPTGVSGTRPPRPGPTWNCDAATKSGPVPVFDNNSTLDLAIGGSVPGTFDLTPGTSYTCKTLAGELSWNAATKKLTVEGDDLHRRQRDGRQRGARTATYDEPRRDLPVGHVHHRRTRLSARRRRNGKLQRRRRRLGPEQRPRSSSSRTARPGRRRRRQRSTPATASRSRARTSRAASSANTTSSRETTANVRARWPVDAASLPVRAATSSRRSISRRPGAPRQPAAAEHLLEPREFEGG